jgi:hypothetical protein
MNFSQILLCEFAIGSNCESEAKANAFQKLRSESEAKSIQFCAKRSEANSLRFAIFRNRANSHCEFGALLEQRKMRSAQQFGGIFGMKTITIMF